MSNLLNTELIQYYPIFFKNMQVHENEEDQALSLSKEDKRLLLLLHTRDTPKQKTTGNFQASQPSLSHSRYKIFSTLKHQHVLEILEVS